MNFFKPPQRPGFIERLEEYQAREAVFSGDALAAREIEFNKAYALNRLEGAGWKSEIDTMIADIWITGRVTKEEYFELCALLAQESKFARENPHPQG